MCVSLGLCWEETAVQSILTEVKLFLVYLSTETITCCSGDICVPSCVLLPLLTRQCGLYTKQLSSVIFCSERVGTFAPRTYALRLYSSVVENVNSRCTTELRMFVYNKRSRRSC